MSFTTKTAVVSKSPDFSHWGGCFTETNLYIILEARGTDINPAANVAHGIILSLQSEYEKYKVKNLETVSKLLNFVPNSELVSLTIGILSDPIFYLGNKGGGCVYITRGGKTGKVLSVDETASGLIQAHDTIIITSKTFEENISPSDREIILNTKQVGEAAELASSILSKLQNGLGCAALILSIAEEKTEEKNVKDDIIKTNLKDKIIVFGRKIINKITLDVDVYGDNEERKSKRRLLVFAFILIIFLVASIFLNINQKKNNQLQKDLTQTLDLISHQYDEAVSLLDLNPARSRTIFTDSKLSLSQLLPKFSKKSGEYQEITNWLNKIAEKEMVAYKIYKLTQAGVFFDIELIKPGGVGSRIAGFEETKAILDTKNKVVYSLATDKKKASIIVGPDVVKNAEIVGIHGKSIYILNEDGILAIDLISKTSRVVIKKDEKWGKINSLIAYGGSIYLLDQGKDMVWKYIVTNEGFADVQRYLNTGHIDLSSSSDMGIDGSVWVLFKEGSVRKFSSGLISPFDFKNFSESLSDATHISVEDNNKNIYILDSASARIVLFDKEGDYKSQYQWDELRQASDILASEAEKKIFVLIGSRIYTIDIR